MHAIADVRIGQTGGAPMSPARRFRSLLRTRFDEVLPTRCVWRNTPPAITYVCRRPKVRV
jgi:phospholipid N-methyltransferase